MKILLLLLVLLVILCDNVIILYGKTNFGF